MGAAMEIFFKGIFFAGMILEVILRIPYDRRRRGLTKTDQRAPVAEQLVLTVLMIGGLLLPLVFAFTPWLDVANYPWSESVNVVLGIGSLVFMAAAIWLFWRAHHDLGAGWSPTLEMDSQQELITGGVYGAVRHPMYTSQLLMGIAQAMLLHNWLAGLGGLVGFLLLYFVRVPSEERMMLDRFGAAYQEYRLRTGSVIPRIHR
jgi:protein-S-isoprenylcysteine O-methyltransferase Ste14